MFLSLYELEQKEKDSCRREKIIIEKENLFKKSLQS